MILSRECRRSRRCNEQEAGAAGGDYRQFRKKDDPSTARKAELLPDWPTYTIVSTQTRSTAFADDSGSAKLTMAIFHFRRGSTPSPNRSRTERPSESPREPTSESTSRTLGTLPPSHRIPPRLEISSRFCMTGKPPLLFVDEPSSTPSPTSRMCSPTSSVFRSVDTTEPSDELLKPRSSVSFKVRRGHRRGMGGNAELMAC